MKQRRGVLTYASKVQPGDRVSHNDETVVVEKVERARGRKPPKGGENLYLVEGDRRVRVHSGDPVRVVRS